VLLALILAWLAWCYVVIANPTLNKVQHADAIVVLGGPSMDDRVAYARELASEGYAPNLLVSVGKFTEHLRLYVACRKPIPGVVLQCFSPSPATTQGEAEQIGRDAKLHGWRRVIVITDSYHVSRARLIVDRCFKGVTIMTAPEPHHTVASLAQQFLYQSVAFAKAELIKTSC
jgi:uncharacterized SAM-binding protein YcdF (DUF218 family)